MDASIRLKSSALNSGMHIRVNGTKIFFDVDGEKYTPGGNHLVEKPTLLLLHGGPGFDHSGFKPYFERFTDIAQVMYFEHRGQGRSERSSPTYWSLHQWAADVYEFCQQLGIEKPIVLGNSFGGFVALKYASTYPDHPAKLIVSSSAAQMNSKRFFEIMEKKGGKKAQLAAKAFYNTPNDKTWDNYLANCFSHYNPTAQDPQIGARAIIKKEVLFHFFADELKTMDMREEIRAIKCPTLITVGKEDPITPVECSEVIHAEIPRSSLSVYKNVGHGAWRDNPNEFEKEIRSFILS